MFSADAMRLIVSFWSPVVSEVQNILQELLKNKRKLNSKLYKWYQCGFFFSGRKWTKHPTIYTNGEGGFVWQCKYVCRE